MHRSRRQRSFSRENGFLHNGTDSKILHGTFKGVDTYPCLLGHEANGEVVEVGSKVKQWKVGDRINAYE